MVTSDYFTFDDVKSSDFGVYISGTETFAVPGRSRQMISVPGRNGDLIMDDGRFENVEVRYSCFIREDFRSRFSDFINFLAKYKSYANLEDTYHLEEIREGVPMLAFLPQTGPANASGRFTISFNCKPQRYLVDGLTEVVYDGSGDLIDDSIRNSTDMVALPSIDVYGYGTIHIGTQTLTILQHGSPYMRIDSESQDAHHGAVNLNAYLQADDFPVLEPGLNVISSDDTTITEIDLTPRWWRL